MIEDIPDPATFEARELGCLCSSLGDLPVEFEVECVHGNRISGAGFAYILDPNCALHGWMCQEPPERFPFYLEGEP